ncbi:MAG: riboflavin biosynthesis protein RibF [Victivallales bacterium]|nr:riboflavin biosynthesis protein RibF [Victivallales bacterium]
MQDGTKKIIEVTSLGALSAHGIARTVIAAGVFDGVHLGHRKLLEAMLRLSREQDAVPAAFTFFPHPRTVLCPDKAPALLYPPYKKLELLAECGVEAVITVPFTRQFAAQSPEDFIRDTLISNRVRLCGICVGSGWHFGAGGKGSAPDLQAFAAAGKFAFEAVKELRQNGVLISSTEIRRALAAGRLDDAAVMLGRHYSISGTVGGGHHVAGSCLGCPTANLQPDYGVLPPCGVYAVRVRYDGKTYVGVVNIGWSPTFEYADVKKPRVEVHLFDFTGNLYGTKLEIEFLQYLREERSFSSPEALKVQIGQDITAIKEMFGERMENDGNGKI